MADASVAACRSPRPTAEGSMPPISLSWPSARLVGERPRFHVHCGSAAGQPISMPASMSSPRGAGQRPAPAGRSTARRIAPGPGRGIPPPTGNRPSWMAAHLWSFLAIHATRRNRDACRARPADRINSAFARRTGSDTNSDRSSRPCTNGVACAAEMVATRMARKQTKAGPAFR